MAHKRLCAAVAVAVAVAGLSISALPHAKAQSQTIEFSQLGDWSVKERPALNLCVLVREFGRGQILPLGRTGAEWGMLTFEDLWSQGPSQLQAIEFTFDDSTFSGDQFEDRFMLRTRDNLVEAIAHFRSDEMLEIRREGEVLYRLSLQGSAAALRELNHCAARYSSRPTVQLPQPPRLERPLAPSPNLATPLPANRNARPIRPDLWFMPDDIGIRDDFAGSTTIGVKMTVSPTGEVVSCEVFEPSDHKEVNVRTCELINQFAKFDPATDNNGQAVVSTYSTKVTF